jgi:hypothetical protein
MAIEYKTQQEKIFFEKLKKKQLYEISTSNDIIVYECENDDTVYVVRVYYDEYIIGIANSTKDDSEVHVLSLSEALNVNLEDLGYSKDMTLFEWLRQCNYVYAKYNRNLDNC